MFSGFAVGTLPGAASADATTNSVAAVSAVAPVVTVTFVGVLRSSPLM